MDKDLLLEKLLPFCTEEVIKNIIIILNKEDEREIIGNLDLFNKIFIIKLAIGKTREIQLNYFGLNRVEGLKGEEYEGLNRIFTIRALYKDELLFKEVIAKQIQYFYIDPNSCSLFASKEEMLSKCDPKLIREDAVEQLWQDYVKRLQGGNLLQNWRILVNPPFVQDILSKYTLEDFPNNEDVHFRKETKSGAPEVLTCTRYENKILLKPLYSFDIIGVALSKEISIVGSLPREYMLKLSKSNII